MLPWKRPEPHEDFDADASALLAELRAEVDRGKPYSFKNREIWGGSWRQRNQPRGLHKTQLVGPVPPWFAKCVWCEQLRPPTRELDVEHYRPKGAVTRWEEDPPIVSDTPPQQRLVSPGYWWLAFSWENFSLACKTCNEGWKRNLFPVAGPRLPCVEGVEDREQPLLIEPGSEFRTRDHFRWDHAGTMEPASKQGYATIVTCGLNRRELRIRRGKVARATLEALDGLLRAFRSEDPVCERKWLGKLAELGSRAEEFTSMVRWLAEERLGGSSWDEFEGLPP